MGRKQRISDGFYWDINLCGRIAGGKTLALQACPDGGSAMMLNGVR
jgi:hypothetical protein